MFLDGFGVDERDRDFELEREDGFGSIMGRPAREA